MQNKLFNRNFVMVVIGQIISLFGNAILSYAIPLYLLNITHSPSIYGTVSACVLIPMLFFTPFGGALADRLNKRNIMVILDFVTALIMFIYSFFIEASNPIVPIVIVLMLLYAIQGLYSPTVYASIPLLASEDNLNSANAIINIVQSLSGIAGPIIGGLVYAKFGIKPVVYISIVCFIISATMEIFIRIPYKKKETENNLFKMVISDFKKGFSFIIKEQPSIRNIALICCLLNFAFVASSSIGLPVIITEYLDFELTKANELFSYCEAIVCVGGILGGIFVSLFGKKLKIQNTYLLMIICIVSLSLSLIAVIPGLSSMNSYVLLVISGFFSTMTCTIISIELNAYLQSIAPNDLLGKIMGIVLCLSMLAQPLGKLIFGNLYEVFYDKMYIVIAIEIVIIILATIWLKKETKNLVNE